VYRILSGFLPFTGVIANILIYFGSIFKLVEHINKVTYYGKGTFY